MEKTDFHVQMRKASTISYNRGKLLSFRRKSIKPPSTVISLLKSLNLFKYRGTRAGVRRRGVSSGVERDGQKITVITGRRPLNQLKLTLIISDNRRLLLDVKLGSREWWRNVDVLSGSFCRYWSTDYVSLRKTKEIKDRKQNNSK